MNKENIRKKFEIFYDDAIRKGTSKYDLAWQAFTYAQHSVQRICAMLAAFRVRVVKMMDCMNGIAP